MPTTTRDVPPEAQQRQGREELKRWREERIAALASRRRAYAATTARNRIVPC